MLRNVCINMFNFLAARKNSTVFINDQSPADRQISKRVKSIGSYFNYANLSVNQRNESQKSTVQKYVKTEVHVIYYLQ